MRANRVQTKVVKKIDSDSSKYLQKFIETVDLQTVINSRNLDHNNIKY